MVCTYVESKYTLVFDICGYVGSIAGIPNETEARRVSKVLGQSFEKV